MRPIITSLCDLDLYKLTVLQAIFLRYSGAVGQYQFTCRNKAKVDLMKYVSESELRAQIAHLDTLSFTAEEIKKLRRTGLFKDAFLLFLKNFRFDSQNQITVLPGADTYIVHADGPMIGIVLYETLILSIVNEIFEQNYTEANGSVAATIDEGFKRLHAKLDVLQRYTDECVERGIEPPKLIEFGTRRRYSAAWQAEVIIALRQRAARNLIGTSNVHQAMLNDMPMKGTFGHEFPMFMQGIVPVQHSQKEALKIWLEVYEGKLGIALSDTLGDAKFARDFTPDLAKAYDGVRHDSGDPFAYGEWIIKLYEGMGIDPRTKQIVFSDGLNIDVMIALHRQFVGRIGISFGIGTDLTNDLGNPVLQIVMKLVLSNGQPVAKLSANPGAKSSCIDKQVLEYVIYAVAYC